MRKIAEPEPREPWFTAPALWLIAFTIVAAYMALAWLTSGRPDWWVLDMVDGNLIFLVDDSYRYFLSRSAWQDFRLYVWDFVLPAALLLDGSLASLLDNDLFLMRCAHALAAAASVVAIYATGRRLGLARLEMLAATAVIAAMPLFVFVSLSFYGEAWLVLFLSLGMYFHVSGHIGKATLAISLLPLIRPEGIFFLVPYGLYQVLTRQWACTIALILPGAIYTALLAGTLDAMGDYGKWRLEIRNTLNLMPSANLTRPLGALSTFNVFWLIPAIVAAFIPGTKRIRPITAGALLWITFYHALMLMEKSDYEARYLISMLPPLAVCWPFAVRWIHGRLGRGPTHISASTLTLTLAILLVAEHTLQLDPIRNEYAAGKRWPVSGPSGGFTFFAHLDANEQQYRTEISRITAAVLQENPEISTVFVNQTPIFYSLDPGALPEGVEVVYITTDQAVSELLLDGVFQGISPQQPHIQYYLFSFGRVGGPGRGLYIGDLDAPGLIPIARRGGHSIYAINFEAARSAEKLLERFEPSAIDGQGINP